MAASNERALVSQRGRGLAIQALMVDVDGVLVDGRPEDGRHWHTSIEEDLGFDPDTLQEHFFAPHWEDIVLGRAGLMEHLNRALLKIAPHVSPAQFVSYWFEKDSRIVAPLLQEISLARSAGIRVYLATNQEHLRAAHLMGKLGLAEHVDGIFYSARLGAKKPDKKFFAKVQAAVGLSSEEILLIDDSPENVEAARKAGWQAHHWTQQSTPDVLRSVVSPLPSVGYTLDATLPVQVRRSMSTAELPIHHEVSRFLSSPRKMLIGNRWVDAVSGKTFPVYNPATGEEIARAADGDSKDADLAVKAARKAFESGAWRDMTAAERGRMMWRLADLVEKNADELAQLESLDNGKPVGVARAADIPLVAEIFRYMAGWTTKIEGNTIPLSVPYAPGAKFFAYTEREPIGVVAQIIPWNFPLLMAAWKLAPALAMGCTVILKPAEQTPLTALRLGELILEAGFPEGVVNIVSGHGAAGAALAAHPDVDKVAFTGSTEVGKEVLKAAGGNLKKVSLELGGKSPNVVFADADIDAAIDGAASAIFFNHGQCCCAGSRLYVEKSIFDDVVAGVSERAKKINVGPGLDPATSMGPLVSQEQLDRVCGYLEAGFAEGARAVTGGKRSGGKGYFVEPTVLVDAPHHAKVVQEEIFGPVVTAMPFEDMEQLVPKANDSMYGLAAGIWTRDVSKAHLLASKLRAGTVWINCYNIFDAALPFGGYKQSGWGREMGHDALDLYTQKKSVCIRL